MGRPIIGYLTRFTQALLPVTPHTNRSNRLLSRECRTLVPLPCVTGDCAYVKPARLLVRALPLLQTIPHPLRHKCRPRRLVTHQSRQYAVLLLLVQLVFPQIDALRRHFELPSHLGFGVAKFCDEFFFVHGLNGGAWRTSCQVVCSSFARIYSTMASDQPSIVTHGPYPIPAR